MRIVINKTDKANCWQWRVLDNCGDTRAAGYCKTKKAATADAQAWINHVNKGEARNAGRVVEGDLLEIKPEWKDPGDQDFNFYAIETQLKGMREVRMRAVNKSTGEPGPGIQSIMTDMLSSHPRA